MADINFSEIEELILNCSAPELSEDFDKSEEHPEYKSHLSTLDSRLRKLFDGLRCLKEVSDTDLRENVKFLASLLLLIEELRTDGAWNTDKSKDQANVLINIFKDAKGYCPSELLQNNDSYKIELFEECLSKLHDKLNPRQWKKYPSAIKVYCAVMDWLRTYSLYVPVSLIFPAALLQMDDHMEVNKLSGLDCSWKIFRSCQGEGDYECGDYEVIVFDVLIQLLRCREIQTLKKSLKSMTILLSLIAKEEDTGKWTRCDDVIQVVLEDVFFESNIESKIIYFKYLPKIIAIHKINFMRWKKKFYNVMYENLEMCAVADYSQSLLEPCLVSYATWLEYCWSVCEYKKDSKILSVLIKLLYINGLKANGPKAGYKLIKATQNRYICERIVNLIVSTLAICTEQQKLNVIEEYNKNSAKVKCAHFHENWNIVKRKLYVETIPT